MSYNKQYKIKSPVELSYKKIINNYIKGYYNFYKKFLVLERDQSLKKLL